MIERPKLVVLLTVLALLGLAILYAYTTTLRPLELGISELGPEHEGKLVKVEGMVIETMSLQSGTIILDLADLEKAGKVAIFIEKDVLKDAGSILQGDIISVKGTVEVYQGEYEIVPSSSEDIMVEERNGPVSPSPEALLASPDIFEGVEIRIEGEVNDTWVNGDEWLLLDLFGGYQIMVKNANSQGTYVGDVRYENTRGWWYLDTSPSGKA